MARLKTPGPVTEELRRTHINGDKTKLVGYATIQAPVTTLGLERRREQEIRWDWPDG